MFANTPRGTKRPNQASTTASAVVGIALLLTLSACTAEDDSPGTTEPPASSEAPTSAPATTEAVDFEAGSPCLLLSADEVATLLGETPEAKEVVISGTTLPACHFGVLGEVGLQVAEVPAGQWAESLPLIYDSLVSLPEGSLDPRILAQIEEGADLLKAGGSIEPEQACGYFSTMLEVNGYPQGSTLAHNYVPDAERPLALSVQQCVDGVYSTLMVTRPDLLARPDLVDTAVELIADLG